MTHEHEHCRYPALTPVLAHTNPSPIDPDDQPEEAPPVEPDTPQPVQPDETPPKPVEPPPPGVPPFPAPALRIVSAACREAQE